MKAYIQLGEGVRLTPKAYWQALQLAMANPQAKFKQSFQDPTGWMGPKTGLEIAQEYRRMIAERWAMRSMAQITIGKGSKAQRRVRHYANMRVECKWCGQATGSVNRRFCEASCARSYNGY